MLASPTATPPHGDNWRHEMKWDGIRAIVTVRNGQCRIQTRSGADASAAFGEITHSHLTDFGDVTIDGEIVAFVNGKPDFRAVMHRLSPGYGRAGGSADPVAAQAPIALVCFDLLRAAGQDITSLPWHARRELLDGAGFAGGAVHVPGTFDDADALLAATRDDGIEGIVSKRIDSTYRPGVRSEDWLKYVHRQTDSFVVVGWRPLAGSVGTLGSILIGEVADGELIYRGRVGTGFSKSTGDRLLEWLTPAPGPAVSDLDRVPAEDLDGTHWVTPSIVVDVEFMDRSANGRLRQPAYKGLRLDLGGIA